MILSLSFENLLKFIQKDISWDKFILFYNDNESVKTNSENVNYLLFMINTALVFKVNLKQWKYFDDIWFTVNTL